MKSLLSEMIVVAQQAVATCGFEVRRRQASNGSNILLLPLLVEHFVIRDGVGTVLQIGANDGVMNDPVRKCILSLDLPALLVEPLPDVFARLQKNYTRQPNVYFENLAISVVSGSAELFRVSPAAKHVPEWMHGIASFDQKHVLNHVKGARLKTTDLEKVIEKIHVPVITIEQLLKKYSTLPPILLLQVDTEGHDFSIIQSSVYAGCLPKIINYEHRHLCFQDQMACRELLASQGYQFYSDRYDTLAVRTTANSLFRNSSQ